MALQPRAAVVAACLVAAVGAGVLLGCADREDPTVRLGNARPAYGEDPAAFVHLARTLLADARPAEREALEEMLTEAAAYEFRAGFWKRLGPRASRGEATILAEVAARIPRYGSDGWSRHGPGWLQRMRALYGENDWFLSVGGAPTEGIEIACRLGRVPVFDADVLPRLTVTQEKTQIEKKSYSGGGGDATVERFRYAVRADLRLRDGSTRTLETSAEDPPLPAVAEFTSWTSDAGSARFAGDPHGYRRASADAVVAAAEALRSALATELAPLPVRPSPSEAPSVWWVAAGLLVACPSHATRPCTSLEELKRALAHVLPADESSAAVAELRDLLSKYGGKGPGAR